MSYDVIIAGAGILGLASAYHLLQGHPGLHILVVERLGGPGRGDTAKSAAAFRDMFSSPVNRALSRGAIAFYDRIEREFTSVGLQKTGYLWLATAAQMAQWRQGLDAMAGAGVEFLALEAKEMAARLPDLALRDLDRGILGRNCGILAAAKLIAFYEREVRRLGGLLRYGREVTGFCRDGQGRINGILANGEKIRGGTVIIATGAWMNRTLARAGLEVPIVPRKRQLFSIPAREGALARLLHTPGFNPFDLLPFTILPGGAYLRPMGPSFILGFANEDQPPGLEEPVQAEREFFTSRIRPQVEQFFPAFKGIEPAYAWAGHYDEHLPDNTPFVARLDGAIAAGGSSGSGVMKGDSLGRVAAGLCRGLDLVELGDGSRFRVADLSLEHRAAPPEAFII